MGSNLRTLLIASAASAAAALLTSQLWIAGTWIAAALTPVIVTLVSDLLNRPTERIARSLTADSEARPEALGTAPPSRPEAARASDPQTTRPGTGGPTLPSAARPRSHRRKIAFGAVFGTAALALVIAVVAITVPELIAGGPAGTNDGRTTFFGERSREPDSQKPQDPAPDREKRPEDLQEQPTGPDDEQPTTPTEEQPTTPPEESPPPGEPLPETVPPSDQP